MNLSKNFTLEELCASSTAQTMGITNIPNNDELANLRELCVYLLQPIREHYGKPVKITSGYRCYRLNKAVGGAYNSSHKYGYAADIKPADGDMKTMQKKILEWAKTHDFDQIIIERPYNNVASWIHVGWKRGINSKQRKQILCAKKINGKWQYSIADLRLYL